MRLILLCFFLLLTGGRALATETAARELDWLELMPKDEVEALMTLDSASDAAEPSRRDATSDQYARASVRATRRFSSASRPGGYCVAGPYMFTMGGVCGSSDRYSERSMG